MREYDLHARSFHASLRVLISRSSSDSQSFGSMKTAAPLLRRAIVKEKPRGFRARKTTKMSRRYARSDIIGLP